uniref:Poly [ADP-ribose] polymerase n=1 Tax=Strongyloides papillosus TaxID=174720 RepID=A0A0N5C4D6_STREA
MSGNKKPIDKKKVLYELVEIFKKETEKNNFLNMCDEEDCKIKNPSKNEPPKGKKKRGRKKRVRKSLEENNDIEDYDDDDEEIRRELKRKAKICSERIIEATFDESIDEEDSYARINKLSHILANCLIKNKQLRDLSEEDIEKFLVDEEDEGALLLLKAFTTSSSEDEALSLISKFTGISIDNWDSKKYKDSEKSNRNKNVFTFENSFPKYYTDIVDSYTLEDVYGDAVDSEIYPVMYSWTDPSLLEKITYKYEDLPDYIKLLVLKDEFNNYIPGQQIGSTIFSIPVKIEKFDDSDDGWKRQILFIESVIMNNIKILLATQLDINVPPPDSNFLELLCCKFYYHSMISLRTDKRRMVCIENDENELKELAEYIRKYGIIGREGNTNLAHSLLTSSYTIPDKSTLFTHPEVPYLLEKIPHIIDMAPEERDRILNRRASVIKVYRNINHGYPHVIAHFNDTNESYDIAMSRRDTGNPWTSVRGYIKDTMTKYNGPTLQQSKPSYTAEKKPSKRVLKLMSQEVLAEDVDELEIIS